jgi:hypothetical protein
MGFSSLNYDLYHNVHVLDSPACLCGYCQETAYHYFFECTLYTNERIILFNELRKLDLELSIELILYGNDNFDFNTSLGLLNAVHTFILDSNRFK